MDVESMTVSELKKELKSRGLKVGGKKADLKARLSEALTVDSISPTDTDAEQQQTDFADFENYINDEYNKINAQNDGDDDAHAVTIDDIINKETAAETETAAVEVEDEEKQIVYAADFDLNAPSEATATNDGTEAETVTAPDFAEEDPAALNSRTKVQSRHERFGNAPIDEAAKVESRKRRFAAMAATDGDGADTTGDGEGGAKKKARVEVDPSVERQRILERSQKFGTKLPTDFKLTGEEAALVHSEQIKRAERFGTQHLLPKEIKRAEFDAKRAERMKRFQTGDGTEAETEAAEKAPAKASNKIIAASPDKDSTKMAERRLRFGTTAAVVTEKEPQQQNKKKGDGKEKGKKMGGKRQDRNEKKFEQFRQYKKNNRNNGGRGGGRGNGRIRARGGGGRNRSRSSGRGGNNNNRRNNNRNGNGNGNANRQQQKQKQPSQVQFNAADRAKMEERKLRFSGGQ